MKASDLSDYTRTLIKNNTVIIGSNKFPGDEKFSGIIMLITGGIMPIVKTDPFYETAEEAEEDMRVIVEQLEGEIDESQGVTIPPSW